MAKNEELGKVIRTWAEQSTAHGIPNISRNKNWTVKSIWLISFFLFTGYCSYGVIQSLRNYLEFNVISDVKTLRKEEIEFPTITVCNKKTFDSKKSQQHLGYYYEQLRQYFIYNNTLGILNKTNQLLLFIDYSLKIYEYDLNLTKDVQINQRFSLSDMLLSCSFNTEQCSKDNFEYLFSFTYGNCYKFNSGIDSSGNRVSIRKISSPGRATGLKLDLFVGYSSAEYDFIKSDGAILFIHNSSYIPMTDMEGVSLSTGFETDIVVSQIFLNRQSKPYSNCVEDLESMDSFDSELYRLTVKTIKKYSQKYCLQYCQQKYFIENCGCYSIHVQNYGEASPCDTKRASGCLYSKSQYFYKYVNPSCFKQCPEECRSVIYNLKISQSTFPSPFMADVLIKKEKVYPSYANFTSIDQIKQSALSVNIFYDDISYTIINEIPTKTFDQFVSDLGGILGICIGCSLLSFIEIIELFIKMIFVLSSCKKTKTETIVSGPTKKPVTPKDFIVS